MPHNIILGTERYMDIDLNASTAVPSAVHGYSLAIQYMKNWFLEKFNDGYFKTIHVNGKHVLADYRRFNPEEKIRQVIKPAVAITPVINVDYNRENIDLLLHGSQLYTRRSSRYKDNFFNDYDKNIHLGIRLKQIEMQFTYHMRVSTRAQQLDLVDYIKVYHRLGATQGDYIDMDCHIPSDIVLAVAIDAGFAVDQLDNGKYKVRDIVSFLKYLNKHSDMPFTYKLRTINGNHEFFIRLNRCYFHISCLDNISIDDGERQGMLDNNFHIDFTATLKIPIPSIFVYYSREHHRIMGKEPDSIYGIYQIVCVAPPNFNSMGWPQYLSTEWVDDDRNIKSINFKPLLDNPDLQRVIQHNNDIGLSSSMFMEIKMFNGQKEIPIRIDWEKYDILINQEQDELKSEISQIAIYADLEYINNTLTNLDNIKNNRLMESSTK